MIYFDNAATTQPSKSVIEKISEVLNDNYGNPSGIYSLGLKAKREINDARHVIANMLGCFDKEILFTSGGSESDNTAIKSVARALKDKGRHIITSSVEHHAVLESCKELEKEGIDVLATDKDGRITCNSNGMVDDNEGCQKERTCAQCRWCIIFNDSDPFDWFADDDVRIYCDKAKKVMASSLRPYEAAKYKPGRQRCPITAD